MRKRPVKALVDALTEGGADIGYLHKSGFPPLQINGRRLTTDYWKINSQQSSQYVSALAMILPMLGRRSVIEFSTDTGSLQYIDMTLELMRNAGLSINRKDNIINYIHGERENVSVSFFVEYDWTSAAVWYTFAALSSEADLFILGLQKSALQADSIIAQWMELFGVQTEYTERGARIRKIKRKIPDMLQLSCKHHPDLVPCLAALSVGLKIKAQLEQVENLSLKESNRIEALTIELGKIAKIKYEGGTLIIEPQEDNFPDTVYFSSWDDHRIATSLSTLCCRIDNLYIENPECVKKSYPDYWDNFSKTNKEDISLF
jgi:3-phosphoshikimate 1-carboxyvinyltransferase